MFSIQPVILQLQIKIPFAEDVPVLQRSFFGPLVIISGKGPWESARKAGGKGDKPSRYC